MAYDPFSAKALGHQGATALGASEGAQAAPSPMSRPGAAAPAATPAAVVPDRRQQQAALIMQPEPTEQPSASSGIMPQQQVNALRDRITKALMEATGDMSPGETFANVGRAAAQAATGTTTFGDAFNAMSAQRLQAARQLTEFLGQERQLALQEQEGARSEKRLAHDIMSNDRAFSLEERRFAKAVADSDRGYDLQVRQFAETVKNNAQNYNLATRQLAESVLTNERNWALSQEELKIKQAAEQRAQMEALSKQGNADAAAVTNAISALPEEVRDVYFAELSELPYAVDSSNIHRSIGEVRRKLEAAGDLPPIESDIAAAEAKVQRIMEAYPKMTRADAIKVADGVMEIRTDPLSGHHTLVDKMTGQGRLIETTLPQAGQPQPAPPGETLVDIANQGDIAGVVPWLVETAGELFGQIPGVPVSEQTAKARQTFRAEQQNLIRSLAVNPRFPVAEMERIRSEINISPSAFDSREALLSRMAGVDQSLRRRLANEERALQDISLPLTTRQNAAQAANDIRNFLAVLGDPEAGMRGGKGSVVPQGGGGLTPDDNDLINRYIGGQ